MTIAGEFRHRASFEARRYGGDVWVFVRELLQNSRDAGASRIELVVERRDGLDRIVCRDDGCGMSFDHARDYLFTLYASSKRGQRDTAGRFGIGFWAVLRFEPDRVVVRSVPENGSGWRVELSGDLEDIRRETAAGDAGTEIELIRASRGPDPVAAVRHAVERDARHLRRRDGGGEILEVVVNGRRATTEIDLPSPSLLITQPGRRGAVALTDQPRVDLLAHGLRVRTAATLDELLTQPDRRRRRRPGVPEGLVPRVVLDSRRLRVLMARGDARTDRELRRLVSLGRRGIRTLVRSQLDREAELGAFGRAWMRCLEVVGSPRVRAVAASVAAVAVVSIGAWWFATGEERPSPGVSVAGSSPGTGTTRRPDAILRADAADDYRGPAADPFDSAPARISLGYRPSDLSPMFAVFRVSTMDEGGRVIPTGTDEALRPYLGAACREACIDVVVDLDGMGTRVRLPIPTGHLLDPASVRVTEGAARLWAAPDGGPLLEFDTEFRGRVHYRTGFGRDNQPMAEGAWPALPLPAEELAASLSALDVDRAAARAREWVRQRVAYDTSQATVERHRAATREGLSFVDRCLTIGSGDCDVQNALLATILARAGVSVRMAIGFVGDRGRSLPGLHAWVEYRRPGGEWRWVDASSAETGRASPGPRPTTAGVGEDETRTPERHLQPIHNDPRIPFGRTVWILAIVAAGAVGAVVFSRRMAVDRVRTADDPDLAGLLRGALTRPETYREVPALFSRRVVPLLNPGSLSLERARMLARRGRLAAATPSSHLARGAVGRGLPIIDSSRAEGQAVATALGAVDLDRWDDILDRGGSHPVSDRLEEAAARVGESWRVVVCDGLSDELMVLDGEPAGLGKRSVVVAFDTRSDLWRRFARCAATRPAAAALLLAGHVADRLGSPRPGSRRWLADLAAEAVAERAGRVL